MLTSLELSCQCLQNFMARQHNIMVPSAIPIHIKIIECQCTIQFVLNLIVFFFPCQPKHLTHDSGHRVSEPKFGLHYLVEFGQPLYTIEWESLTC